MSKDKYFNKNKPEEVITNAEIEEAFRHTSFGTTYAHREILDNTVLKCACGWYTGHTARGIAQSLGLVTAKWKLTKKGQYYLWVVYSQGKSL